TVDFFSMIIYETFREKSSNESALVINVKPEWIFDNLKVVNDFAIPGQSALFIMDKNGGVILSSNDQNVPVLTGLKETLAEDQEQNKAKFGFFAKSFGKSGKFIVSYMDMGIEGWKVVSIQPYHAVLGDIYEMRMTSLYVILFFLLVSIALSSIVAHKLYKPVEKMLVGIQTEARLTPEDLTEGKDELSYVTNVYRDMAQRLDAATNEQDKQKRIVYNYHLRSITTGSSFYSIEQFYICVKQNNLDIVPDGCFLLVIIKLDDYTEYVSHTSVNQRMLHSFAIANIAKETLLSSQYSCEIVDMRTDHLVVILSAIRGEGTPLGEIVMLLRDVQDIVERYYKLSLTMTTSEPFLGHEAITEQYGLALQYSMYKLVFGKRVIITPDLVKPNMEHSEYGFPAEQEKKLIESIRTNDLVAMKSEIHYILAHMSIYQYDHILHGIVQIVDLIKTTIREINKNRVVSISVDLSALSRQVLNKESLDEIEQLLQQVCCDINEKLNNSIQEKNTVLVEAIKEIVTVNYSDINLSLQSIAVLLKITPAYVGRMFKKSELVSVGEYINEVRLAQALIYLETKDFSIKEIMEICGYMNQSTFFKLFKKKYGATPKEYRLKSNIG
ncbi:MAG: helix-turn-helix domain-containing protein, partial [Gorillibacterium sp.]|nr:helix-turn-helix domain-containing protein [Gorillibacterium sp.]